MDRKKKNRIAIALGVITGAAAGWWLNSERGRKFRQDTADKAVDVSKQIGDSAKEQLSNLSDNLTDMAGQSKETVAKASERIKDGVNQLANQATTQVENGEDAFKKGADQAKSKLREIEKILEQ